jgi:hypothetical protein
MGTIRYYLRSSSITSDPNDQVAFVQPKEILDPDMLAERMVKRSSSFTLPVIKGVLSLFFDVASDEIADGKHVNTPLVNIRPSISGVFTSASDNFDPSRHIVKSSGTGGTLLNSKIALSQTEKIHPLATEPYLIEYTDVNSSTINSLVTKGGIGMIVGEELKFSWKDEDEGVFFVSQANVATRVETYAVVTEGKIIFSIPSTLTAGTYTLEVRRQYGVAKTVRKGQLRETLTVS